MPRHSISDKYDAIIGFDLFNRGICAKIDKQRGLLILTDEKKLFRAEEKAGYTLARLDVFSTHREGEGFDQYIEIQRGNARALRDAFDRARAMEEAD